MSSKYKSNYVGDENEGTPLLAKANMENQNMGYTTDNEDGSKPPPYEYDASVDNTATQQPCNHQIEERRQNNVIAYEPQRKDVSTPGSLFRSEEMTLCQMKSSKLGHCHG